MNQAITTGTWEQFNESSNDYRHMRAVQWIKLQLREQSRRVMVQAKTKAQKCRLMSQAMTTGTWKPFNESINYYGHMRAVQWIKKWLRPNESLLMSQVLITGTWEPFNELSNDYEHMRAVQWIRQWLWAPESRPMIQAMAMGPWEPLNESSSK
jgi:hypothetical protein